jgi:hypothetical protein
MTRRFRNTLITLIGLAIVIASLYFIFIPDKNTQQPFDQLNPVKIEYSDLINHLEEKPQAFFFCTETHPDCLYIDNEILDALIEDANTDRFMQIFFVDATPIDETILPSAIKKSLGFSRYPAFALLSKEQNKIIVHSVYEWSDEAIFTMLGLKAWMNDNGLWLPEYTN